MLDELNTVDCKEGNKHTKNKKIPNSNCTFNFSDIIDTDAPEFKFVVESPPNYIILSIISFLFNYVLGTIAIMMSISSINCKKQSKIEIAKSRGKYALIISILGIISGTIFYIIFVLIYVYREDILNLNK
ncbi:hypothetical protein A3Q56_04336 [Intoshia linei]|uniref:Interferon-induced transmembrane protein n=1 Tax=Intoshia linei TaxID=1819745 RepID=A0A177B2N0_9BILA|nr:hypothetical protein A3Q56_04336 [Intoshia linei]